MEGSDHSHDEGTVGGAGGTNPVPSPFRPPHLWRELDLEDERLEIYRQCEAIMQEDVCYVPTTYMINPFVFKPWIKGLPVNAQGFTIPNGNIYVNMLSDVYIEGREA